MLSLILFRSQRRIARGLQEHALPPSSGETRGLSGQASAAHADLLRLLGCLERNRQAVSLWSGVPAFPPCLEASWTPAEQHLPAAQWLQLVAHAVLCDGLPRREHGAAEHAAVE